MYFSQRAQHGAAHAMTVSVAVVGAIALLDLGLVWLLPRSAPPAQHEITQGHRGGDGQDGHDEGR